MQRSTPAHSAFEIRRWRRVPCYGPLMPSAVSASRRRLLLGRIPIRVVSLQAGAVTRALGKLNALFAQPVARARMMEHAPLAAALIQRMLGRNPADDTIAVMVRLRRQPRRCSASCVHVCEHAFVLSSLAAWSIPTAHPDCVSRRMRSSSYVVLSQAGRIVCACCILSPIARANCIHAVRLQDKEQLQLQPLLVKL
jgi:hypothetical protein